MSSSEWEFVLALPNLRIAPDRDPGDSSQFPSGITLDSDVVAITGGEDRIVTQIRSESSPVNQILSSFRDEYGNGYIPAVMLARKAAPDKLKHDAGAFNDFRNAVAMSMVLPGKAAHAVSGGNMRPTWADTFDFHPALVGKLGNVIIQSPALNNLVGPDLLYLSPSPSISVHSFGLYPDRFLYRCLGREWRRRYVRPARNDLFSRRLFRSLEVAYQAASVGVKSYGSSVEYGTQIALWVSAIEILAWALKGKANLSTVFELLDRVQIGGGLQHRRYRTTWREEPFRLNAVQHCYLLLYGARNHFLHGNPVSFTTLLARRPGKRLSLPQIAPLVYRYALKGYLSQRYALTDTFKHMARDILELVDESSYEEAVAQLMGLKAPRRRSRIRR